MKKCCLVVLCVLCTAFLAAQGVQWQWANSCSSDYTNECLGVAVDSDGSYYITGYYYGLIHFGDIQLGPNSIVKRMYVAKYSSWGQPLWARDTGGEGQSCGYSVVCDATGNVYVTGTVTGSVNFWGAAITATGACDAFVACIDSEGNWLWAIRAGGGNNAVTYPRKIVLGSENDLFVCGYFTGTAGFGSQTINSEGLTDIWVAKLGRMGVWHWAAQAGGAEADYCTSLTLLPGQGVALCGYIRGYTTFGDISFSGGGTDTGFVAWLSQSAVWENLVTMSSSSECYCNDLKADSQGNIYVTGDFSTDLQCGPYEFTGNWLDIFIARINGNSKVFEWVNAVPTVSDGHGDSIAITPDDRIYWTGYFLGTINFGFYSLTNVSSPDIFLVRLTPEGYYRMAEHAGNICEDLVQDMVVDGYGNVCLAGYYSGDMYFGDIHLPMHGNYNTFIAKMHETVSSDDPLPEIPQPGLSNYPNPFRSGTTLCYSIKENSPSASLKIYDLRGRLILDCGAVPTQAGEHQVPWNGQDGQGRQAPAGVYLLRLQTSHGTSASRMVLLR